MPRYLTLLNFTPQGAKALDKSVDRSRAVRTSAASLGAKVEAIYWALGEFDGAVIFDAPDEQTATSLMVVLARAGNVQTRTTRLYDEAEFSSIVAAAAKV